MLPLEVAYVSKVTHHTFHHFVQGYLEAGSDIIETNTFSGTSIAQADYGTENLVISIVRQYYMTCVIATHGRNTPSLHCKLSHPYFSLSVARVRALPTQLNISQCHPTYCWTVLCHLTYCWTVLCVLNDRTNPTSQSNIIQCSLSYTVCM